MSQQKQEMEEGKEKEKYENDENQNRIMSFEDFETRMLHDFETLTKRFQNEMENYFTKFKLEIKAEFAKNSSKANVDREHDGKQRQSDRTGRLSEGIVDKTAENNDASKSARMSASDGFLMAKTEVKREVETPPPIIQKPPSKEQKSVNETSDKTPNKRFFSIHGPKPVTGLSLTVKNAPSRQSIAKKVDYPTILPTMVPQRPLFPPHYFIPPLKSSDEGHSIPTFHKQNPASSMRPKQTKILPKPRHFQPYPIYSRDLQPLMMSASFVGNPRFDESLQQNYAHQSISEEQQSLVRSPKVLTPNEMAKILKSAKETPHETSSNQAVTSAEKTKSNLQPCASVTPSSEAETASESTRSISVIDISDDEASKTRSTTAMDEGLSEITRSETPDLEVDDVFGHNFRGSKYCTKKELIEAMKYAGRFGVAEAARKFNIPPQHLTYWYRKYGRNRVEQLPENIDRDLIDHIIEYKRTHQSDHLAGYTLYVLIKQFLQKKYPGTLYEDGGWVSLKDRWIDGFLQRIADRERSLISDEQILRQMNQMNQLPLLLLAAELLKAQNQSHENERQS